MSTTDRLQSIKKTHDSPDPTDVPHVQRRSMDKPEKQQGHRVYIEQFVAETHHISSRKEHHVTIPDKVSHNRSQYYALRAKSAKLK